MAALGDQVAGAAIGVRVRDFYEKHPYPLGLDDLKGYARTWNIVSAGAPKHISFGQVKPFRDDRSILVVGCGTSQAAKHALRWPNAHVTGHRRQQRKHRGDRKASSASTASQSRIEAMAARGRRRVERNSIKSCAREFCTI